MADQRLNKLAKLLVNYSTEVKLGDFVFVMCEDVAAPWAAEVVKEAILAGGHVETLLNNTDVAQMKLKYSTDEQLKEDNYLMETMLTKADVWLTAWGTVNTKASSNVPSDKIRLSAIGAKKWRTVYSEKMGDGSLRWCGTQYPTNADAQEASMNFREYEEFVYGAGLLNYDDPVAEWKRISAEQDRWVNYLNTKKELHILSEETDIKVCIDGRKWINCDGRVNFPDGEVFTSPIEDRVNGHITFSFPAIYSGKEVEGVKLEVENGKVVKATAKKGEELLNSLLQTDEGACHFGEVAIGTNYGIKNFTKNILFDEKIGGTIHMAIGDSMPEAGGKNKSSIHWDMICDMRTNGKIYADGELFYENGKFKEELLAKYGF